MIAEAGKARESGDIALGSRTARWGIKASCEGRGGERGRRFAESPKDAEGQERDRKDNVDASQGTGRGRAQEVARDSCTLRMAYAR